MTEGVGWVKSFVLPTTMNTETPAVSNARIAVLAASDELKSVQSGIRFAKANPAEVTKAEVETLLARSATLTARIDALMKAYDKAVRTAESR